MPDEFSSASKGLKEALTEAIVKYGREQLGRELNAADLYQMTTSLDESAREILWFGFDLWPLDTQCNNPVREYQEMLPTLAVA